MQKRYVFDVVDVLLLLLYCCVVIVLFAVCLFESGCRHSPSSVKKCRKDRPSYIIHRTTADRPTLLPTYLCWTDERTYIVSFLQTNKQKRKAIIKQTNKIKQKQNEWGKEGKGKKYTLQTMK
jgi:hypothetical protein